MSSDTGVTITLKTEHSTGGPWVVIKGADADEAQEHLERVLGWTNDGQTSLAELTHRAQLEFNALANAVYGAAPGVTRFAAPGAPVPVQNAAPQPEARPDFVSPSARRTAPPVSHPQASRPAPQCKHGEMQYRSGITNKPGTKNHGLSWEGFFCSAPKGAPDQCKAQFD